jgi:hypothetical protein
MKNIGNRDRTLDLVCNTLFDIPIQTMELLFRETRLDAFFLNKVGNDFELYYAFTFIFFPSFVKFKVWIIIS